MDKVLLNVSFIYKKPQVLRNYLTFVNNELNWVILAFYQMKTYESWAPPDNQ